MSCDWSLMVSIVIEARGEIVNTLAEGHPPLGCAFLSIHWFI